MLLTRLRVLLSRMFELVFRRREQRLSEEIADHLARLQEAFIAQGMAEDEARFAARRAFGGVDQIAAHHREQRGMPGLESWLQDFRFAIRLLRKDAAFTCATVAALALGLGAATTVFTIVKGMNLTALPVAGGREIMYLRTQHAQTARVSGVSYPDFLDWQKSRSFEGLAALSGATMNVGDDSRPADRFGGTYVSANAFGVLGEQPVLGRDFRPEDDRRGAPAVALISHRLWHERYSGSAEVIGRVVRINGVPATVVGVMREGFRFPLLTDVWQPLGQMSSLQPEERAARSLGVFGRLAHGTDVAAARAELAGLAAALAVEYPESNAHVLTSILPFTEQFAGRMTDAAPMMMTLAVSIVLVIACANAAGLLLSRSVPRARELSLRAAMGASRWRLIRQLLVESLTLAAMASVAGLLLSRAGVGLFTRETADFNLPYWMDFTIDWQVFFFLSIACVATACLCGLLPAWQLSRVSASEVIKEGGRGLTPGVRVRRFTTALLVGEMALTLTLLSGAGFLLRRATTLWEADARIDAAQVLAARFALPTAQYASEAERRRFIAAFQAALDRQPAIASATIANTMPFVGAPGREIVREGDPVADERRDAVLVLAGEHYFATLGVRLVRGRELSADDLRPGQEGVIVNERVAERLFAGEDPIGRRVRLADPATKAPTAWLTIVGVSPSIRQAPAAAAGMVVYLPLAMQPPSALAVIARGSGDGSALASALREDLMAIDPDVALYGIATLERISEQSRWIPRAMSTALTIVGAIALILSAVGLYGTTAYAVAQRTSEVGIRVALGARRSQVRWLFLREVCIRLGAGAVLGLAGSIAVSQILGGVVAGTSGASVIEMGIAVALLTAVAVVAALLPARRATRLDPVAALRHD